MSAHRQPIARAAARAAATMLLAAAVHAHALTPSPPSGYRSAPASPAAPSTVASSSPFGALAALAGHCWQGSGTAPDTLCIAFTADARMIEMQLMRGGRLAAHTQVVPAADGRGLETSTTMPEWRSALRQTMWVDRASGAIAWRSGGAEPHLTADCRSDWHATLLLRGDDRFEIERASRDSCSGRTETQAWSFYRITSLPRSMVAAPSSSPASSPGPR